VIHDQVQKSVQNSILYTPSDLKSLIRKQKSPKEELLNEPTIIEVRNCTTLEATAQLYQQYVGEDRVSRKEERKTKKGKQAAEKQASTENKQEKEQNSAKSEGIHLEEDSHKEKVQEKQQEKDEEKPQSNQQIEQKIVALNFASAKHPGGGFLGGSQAQEESLARCSSLYENLTKFPDYYSSNARDRTCVYTHHMIYSPDVAVFRKDNGELLQNFYPCSFITSAAVNWGVASTRVKDDQLLADTLKERAAMVLAVAANHGHKVLVLGAWGCGVFRCPVLLVANIFRSLLLPQDAPFHNAFQHVVFAMLDPVQEEIFDSVMKSDQEAVEVAMKKLNLVLNKRTKRQENMGKKDWKEKRREKRQIYET